LTQIVLANTLPIQCRKFENGPRFFKAMARRRPNRVDPSRVTDSIAAPMAS